MAEPADAQAPSGAESHEERLSTFRYLDILLGINQACSEAAHHLRILHLYQLRRDQKTFRQQLAALAVFLVVLIPSLSPLIQAATLRNTWYAVVGVVLLLYIWAARDKALNKDVKNEYEDADFAASLVRLDKKRLLRDQIYSYCTRHDILYNMHHYADDQQRQWIFNALDACHEAFDRAKRNLLDLRDSGTIKPNEYEALTYYIETCEGRSTALRKGEGAA